MQQKYTIFDGSIILLAYLSKCIAYIDDINGKLKQKLSQNGDLDEVVDENLHICRILLILETQISK